MQFFVLELTYLRKVDLFSFSEVSAEKLGQLELSMKSLLLTILFITVSVRSAAVTPTFSLHPQPLSTQNVWSVVEYEWPWVVLCVDDLIMLVNASDFLEAGGSSIPYAGIFNLSSSVTPPLVPTSPQGRTPNDNWLFGDGFAITVDFERGRIFASYLTSFSKNNFPTYTSFYAFAIMRIDLTPIPSASRQLEWGMKQQWITWTESSNLPEDFPNTCTGLQIDLTSGDVIASGNYQGDTWFGQRGIAGSPFPQAPSAWDTATGFSARLSGVSGEFLWVSGSGNANENGMYTSVLSNPPASVLSLVGGYYNRRWLYPGLTTNRLFGSLSDLGTGTMLTKFRYADGSVQWSAPVTENCMPTSALEITAQSNLIFSMAGTTRECVIGSSPPSVFLPPLPASQQLFKFQPNYSQDFKVGGRVLFSFSAISVDHNTSVDLQVELLQTLTTEVSTFLVGRLITTSPSADQQCVNFTTSDSEGIPFNSFLLCVPNPAQPIPFPQARTLTFVTTLDANTGALITPITLVSDVTTVMNVLYPGLAIAFLVADDTSPVLLATTPAAPTVTFYTDKGNQIFSCSPAPRSNLCTFVVY